MTYKDRILAVCNDDEIRKIILETNKSINMPLEDLPNEYTEESEVCQNCLEILEREFLINREWILFGTDPKYRLDWNHKSVSKRLVSCLCKSFSLQQQTRLLSYMMLERLLDDIDFSKFVYRDRVDFCENGDDLYIEREKICDKLTSYIVDVLNLAETELEHDHIFLLYSIIEKLKIADLKLTSDIMQILNSLSTEKRESIDHFLSQVVNYISIIVNVLEVSEIEIEPIAANDMIGCKKCQAVDGSEDNITQIMLDLFHEDSTGES
ncbi:MAG: hypothetical protein HOC09_01865 [Deltaproteobacteria bacterium]|jgi:hypothetical protein|nr:hypothetical protein [Deltaproteobacteria bacterium]